MSLPVAGLEPNVMECRPQPLGITRAEGPSGGVDLADLGCVVCTVCSRAQGAGSPALALPRGDSTYVEFPGYLSVNSSKNRRKIHVSFSSLAPLHMFKKNHSLSQLIMKPLWSRKGKGVPLGQREVQSRSWVPGVRTPGWLCHTPT